MQLTMTSESKTFPVWLKVRYYSNGNLAIVLYYINGDIIDIWTVVTANLGFLCDKNCSYIDTNNNGEEIRDWLVQNKLATPTRRSDRSGYCTYPIYEFDPEVLKRLDPEGYNEYIEYWETALCVG